MREQEAALRALQATDRTLFKPVERLFRAEGEAQTKAALHDANFGQEETARDAGLL